MRRLFGTLAVLLAFNIAATAADKAPSDVKEFIKDIEQLNGSWMSPKMVFGQGITGNFALKLEFKKDSTIGQATVMNFPSKNGVVVNLGPWNAELKTKDKKRYLVLSDIKTGKRVELGEIAYEVNGNKLKFTDSKALQFEKGGRPVEMNGEWARKKAEKK